MDGSPVHSPKRQGQTPPAVRRFLPWLALGAGVPLILAIGILGVAAHLENSDRFCAACHTQHESIYVARAEQPAVDLASAHADKEVACIDCHSGEGIPGRVEAMLLGARDLSAYVLGNYPQPAPLTHPISDANCLKCHREVLGRRTFDNHFHFFLPRWQIRAGEAAASCVSCHTSHTTDGEEQILWLNRDTTASLCRECHRFAS